MLPHQRDELHRKQLPCPHPTISTRSTTVMKTPIASGCLNTPAANVHRAVSRRHFLMHSIAAKQAG